MTSKKQHRALNRARAKRDQAKDAELPPTLHGPKLAEVTGFQDHFHRDLANSGWFPAPKLGHYKTKETLRGIFNYLRQNKGDPAKKKTSDLRNQILEHSLAVRRKDYFKTDAVKRVYTRAAVGIKTRLLSVPDALAPRLALLNDPAEIKRILRADIINALRELEGGEWFEGQKAGTG